MLAGFIKTTEAVHVVRRSRLPTSNLPIRLARRSTRVRRYVRLYTWLRVYP